MIICSDDFNRANENPLGGNWTTCPYWSNMKIESNQCKGIAYTLCGAYWNANTFPNDQWAQIDIVSLYCAVNVRVSTTVATLYHLFVESAASASLYRGISGSYTKLGSSFNITGIKTLKLEVQGTLLSVYGDGVLLGTRTDASIASGTVGIYSYNMGILDNFMAGDFTADGTIIPVLMAQYRQRWR